MRFYFQVLALIGDCLLRRSEAEYKVHRVNSNSCPDGYSTITRSDDCRAAASSLGIRYARSLTSASNTVGCFIQQPGESYQLIFYNTHATGAATGVGAPICTSEAAALTECPGTGTAMVESDCKCRADSVSHDCAAGKYCWRTINQCLQAAVSGGACEKSLVVVGSLNGGRDGVYTISGTCNGFTQWKSESGKYIQWTEFSSYYTWAIHGTSCSNTAFGWLSPHTNAQVPSPDLAQDVKWANQGPRMTVYCGSAPATTTTTTQNHGCWKLKATQKFPKDEHNQWYIKNNFELTSLGACQDFCAGTATLYYSRTETTHSLNYMCWCYDRRYNYADDVRGVSSSADAKMYECVEDSGNNVESTTIIATTTANPTPVPMALASGWVVATAPHSCDQACAVSGRVCTEQGLCDRNHEIDSRAKLEAVVGRSCTTYDTQWLTSNDLPVIGFGDDDGYCFATGSQRPCNTFDCSKTTAPTDQNKRRICYCIQECNIDSDCEAGMVCGDDGHCVDPLPRITATPTAAPPPPTQAPTETECSIDSDCEAGMVCGVDGYCVDRLPKITATPTAAPPPPTQAPTETAPTHTLHLNGKTCSSYVRHRNVASEAICFDYCWTQGSSFFIYADETIQDNWMCNEGGCQCRCASVCDSIHDDVNLNIYIVQAPPTLAPTPSPTQSPKPSPSWSPTSLITPSPTLLPTQSSTESPTVSTTQSPTRLPTQSPRAVTTTIYYKSLGLGNCEISSGKIAQYCQKQGVSDAECRQKCDDLFQCTAYNLWRAHGGWCFIYYSGTWADFVWASELCFETGNDGLISQANGKRHGECFQKHGQTSALAPETPPPTLTPMATPTSIQESATLASSESAIGLIVGIVGISFAAVATAGLIFHWYCLRRSRRKKQQPPSPSGLSSDLSRRLGISMRFVTEVFPDEVRDRRRRLALHWPSESARTPAEEDFYNRWLGADAPSVYEMNFFDLSRVVALGRTAYGLGITCPRDSQPDCSIVDALYLDGHSRIADIFLSWVWGYTFDTACSALTSHRVLSSEIRQGDDCSIWWCFFNNNQFRILGQQKKISFEDLRLVFGTQLQNVGKMVCMMDHVANSAYSGRLWCLFEVYVAADRAIPMQVMLPGDAIHEVESIMMEGGFDGLRQAMRISAEEAKASFQEDEAGIKALIQDMPGGYATVNEKVHQALRQGITSLMGHALRDNFGRGGTVSMSHRTSTFSHRTSTASGRTSRRQDEDHSSSKANSRTLSVGLSEERTGSKESKGTLGPVEKSTKVSL